ncbi:hypothetical protein N9C84_03755 [Desulfobacterales bacterium]|nr:hypothetical protein [Desulfobacterales bacterium]
MAEYDLCNNFNKSTGTACISGRMAPEIVGPQMDANKFANFNRRIQVIEFVFEFELMFG